MSRQTDPEEIDLTINRRSVLKASGATAIGLTAFAGTGSAHPPTEIRFCGCSQVCVKTASGNSYRILYATETTEGYTCSLEPSITDDAETESDCFTVDPDEKILGVLDGTRTMYLNPNTCAQRAIDDLGDLNDCAGCTEDDGSDGGCITTTFSIDDYTREGRHEYVVNGITIRTRLCKPPDQWNGEPNGPPSRNGLPNENNGSPSNGGPPNN